MSGRYLLTQCPRERSARPAGNSSCLDGVSLSPKSAGRWRLQGHGHCVVGAIARGWSRRYRLAVPAKKPLLTIGTLSAVPEEFPNPAVRFIAQLQGTPPHRNSPVILLQFGPPNPPPTSRIWRNYSVLPHFLQPIIHLSHSQENRLEAALSLKGREPGATPPQLADAPKPLDRTPRSRPPMGFPPWRDMGTACRQAHNVSVLSAGASSPIAQGRWSGRAGTKPGCRLLRVRESKKSKEESVLRSRALWYDSKDRTSREVPAALGP